MLEHDTFPLRSRDGTPVRWISGVDTGKAVFTGCGPTEDAALLDAMEKASHESDAARAELAVLLGVRGNGMGGRPTNGTNQGTS